MRCLLVLLSVSLLTGTALMTQMLYAPEGEYFFKVDLQFGEPQLVEFGDIAIIPGYHAEVDLITETDKNAPYDLTFSFVHTGQERNALHDNFYIKIEYNGKVYCDNALSELFELDELLVTIDLTEASTQSVKVIYYIPESVGNEIQGCDVDFELYTTVIEKRDWTYE